MEVGRRITFLREKKNMSTNKLANIAGISQSYLREIELGKKNPTVEMLSYICDAMKKKIKEFFTIDNANIDPFLMSVLETLSNNEQIKLAEFLNELKK